ncbi:MAG: glutamyl-tRNA reductase [Deltaproteobacteria bacterium]|nr:glutamyl-tRNA reductase [Deltaproteobacteria bacterium]
MARPTRGHHVHCSLPDLVIHVSGGRNVDEGLPYVRPAGGLPVNIVLVGMNHQSAPVEIREKIASDRLGAEEFLRKLSALSSVLECLFLSTCNRVETLIVSLEPKETVQEAVSLLTGDGDLGMENWGDYLYALEGHEAVRHLFRVSSSLDSMVLGEPQILGQLKEAYRFSVQHHCTGVVLNRLLHRAFFVAKRVRSETGIGSSAVSVSYAAVELARKIFGDLTAKKVLLIGAGEMAELALRHLWRNGIKEIVVANRTLQRALDLASEFRGSAVTMEEIVTLLASVDIVISSTASRDYVLTHRDVQGLMRKRRNRPLFFIDIAVPRDIDPRINEMPNMYVYDIDELRNVVDENVLERQQEALKGERIVKEETIKFEKWLDTLDVVPTIKHLIEWAERIRKAELDKTMPRLGPLSSQQISAIDSMSSAIVKKLLHNPVQFLKRGRKHEANRESDIDLTRSIFALNGDE